MSIRLFPFAIFLYFLFLSHEASISLNPYFEATCNTSCSFNYQLSPINSYYVSNGNFTISSIITLQPSISNAVINITFISARLTLIQGGNLTITGCQIYFDYSSDSNPTGIFTLNGNSSLQIMNGVLSLDSLNGLTLVTCSSFFSLVLSYNNILLTEIPPQAFLLLNVSNGLQFLAEGLDFNWFDLTRIEILQLSNVSQAVLRNFDIIKCQFFRLFTFKQVLNLNLLAINFLQNTVFEYVINFNSFPDSTSVILMKSVLFKGNNNTNLANVLIPTYFSLDFGFIACFVKFLNINSSISITDTIFSTNSILNMSLIYAENVTNLLLFTNLTLQQNEVLDSFSPAIRLFVVNSVNFSSSTFQFNNNLNTNRTGTQLVQIQEFETVQLSSSIFSNNYALSTTSGLEMINLDDIWGVFPEIMITNCSFTNNYVNSSLESPSQNPLDFKIGAAIIFYSQGNIIITLSNFSNNSIFLQDSTVDVGTPCIFGHDDSFLANLSISDCFFSGNVAFSMSSCISFLGGNFQLLNSIFKSNSIINNNTVPASYHSTLWKTGSNVYLNVMSMNIMSCSFENAFGISGSALTLLFDCPFYISPGVRPIGTFNMTNLSIINSSSFDDGGSIQIEARIFQLPIILIFSQCQFVNSIANANGGVLFLLGSFDYLSELLFESCSFSYSRASKGGVLYNMLSNFDVAITKSSLICNGAFKSSDGSNGDGGVIYSMYNIDFNVSNCSFLHNYAYSRGSLLFFLDGHLQDSNSVYYNNTAQIEGGMLFLMNLAFVAFNNSNVSLSFANVKAGFAELFSESQLILTGCILENVSSITSAFIHSREDSSFQIYNSYLQDFYSSDLSGNIISVLGTDNTVEIMNCTINGWKTLNRSHFEISSTNFFLMNSTISNAKGYFLWARFSDLFLQNISIQNYNCSILDSSTYCLFSLQNVVMNLNGLSVHDTILYNRQSFVLCLLSTMNISAINISSFNTVNPFTINLLYVNFLFFIQESQYNFTNGVISNINLTAFQIILSSGIFHNLNVSNSFDPNISGQFISCFICIKLTISSCFINGMTSDIAPVLQLNDVYQSFFFQTQAGYDLVGIEQENASIFVQDSVFSNNYASVQGGAFYILDFSFVIQNCTFIQNSAGQGGAILFNCTNFADSSICKWTIRTTSFISNSASIRGGAYHWLNREPELENSNIFQNNFALHGSDYSSNPIKLEINSTDQSEQFTSGYPTPNATLSIYLLDTYDQIYYDTTSLAYLLFDKSAKTGNLLQKFVSNQFVQMTNGSFFFEGFTIVSEPGNNANLLVYSDAINYVSPYLNLSSSSPDKNINDQYYYAFSIFIRDCKQGEIYLSDQNLCFRCPDGFFSFYPSDSQCNECPENAICLKNQPFQVQKGYWRINANSSKIYRCNIKKAGCVGGTFEQQCQTGFTGPLCSACVFNETDKYFNSFGGCSKCGSSNTFLILITVVILLSGMVGLIFFSIKDSQTFIEKEDLKEVLVTVLINILINYTQLFSVITNIDIKWPDFFSSSSSSSSPTSITDFIGVVECTIASFAYDHKFSTFYVEMVIMTFLFFGMLIGNLLFWFLFKIVRQKWLNRKRRNSSPPTPTSVSPAPLNLKNNIILTYIAIYVLMLQPLLNFFTKGFNCIEVGDGKTSEHFLKVFPAIECWGDTHISLIKNVIVPFLVVFIVPPPLIMLYYIYKNYKSTDKNIIQRLFMVTVGYKNKYCYWEFVILLKKIILMYLSIFIRDEPVVCVLTLLFVLLVFCNLHLIFKPYEYEFLNNLIVEQYIALFVCYSVFLYFSYTDSYSASIFLIFILFVANVIFLGHWAYYFYFYFKQSLKNLRTAFKSMKQITSAALKRFETRRKNALVRSQSTLSKNKFTPRGSKMLNLSEDQKKVLKTTPGKSQVGSHEDCEIMERPFISERKCGDDKNEIGNPPAGDKFQGMLIIQEEK